MVAPCTRHMSAGSRAPPPPPPPPPKASEVRCLISGLAPDEALQLWHSLGDRPQQVYVPSLALEPRREPGHEPITESRKFIQDGPPEV